MAQHEIRCLSLQNTPNNFLKGLKWSPDGSCFLASSEDNTLSLFYMPQDGDNSNGYGVPIPEEAWRNLRSQIRKEEDAKAPWAKLLSQHPHDFRVMVYTPLSHDKHEHYMWRRWFVVDCSMPEDAIGNTIAWPEDKVLIV